MKGEMKIYKLTHNAIKPYGYIIDSRCVKDIPGKDAFGILLRERSRGWRIGYLIVREKKAKMIEEHPDSLETFEPVKGRAVLALAAYRDPLKLKFFLLDKPVVVKKKVWHGIVTISKKSEIKIFENIEVKTKRIYL